MLVLIKIPTLKTCNSQYNHNENRLGIVADEPGSRGQIHVCRFWNQYVKKWILVNVTTSIRVTHTGVSRRSSMHWLSLCFIRPAAVIGAGYSPHPRLPFFFRPTECLLAGSLFSALNASYPRRPRLGTCVGTKYRLPQPL